MNLISVAQAAEAAPQQGAGSNLTSVLLMVAMFAILYFTMIRPQAKKAKETKAMQDALSKGDEIVTSGGLVGRVSRVGESYIQVMLNDGVEVQLQRGAISMVLPKGTHKISS